MKTERAFLYTSTIDSNNDLKLVRIYYENRSWSGMYSKSYEEYVVPNVRRRKLGSDEETELAEKVLLKLIIDESIVLESELQTEHKLEEIENAKRVHLKLKGW